MAAMTSFHAEKCCVLVSAQDVSAWRLYTQQGPPVADSLAHSYQYLFSGYYREANDFRIIRAYT